MSLGLGSNKQDSSSNSTSDSYGYNSGVSTSDSSSSSVGSSSSRQSIAFQDLFQNLYGGASTAAKGALANAPELASAARQLFTGGSQFLQSLGGGNAGTDYMESRLSGDNPALQQQIDLLREDTGRLFTDQFNPAITSRSVQSGNLGGSRQGVAQGIAMDSLARQFTQGAAQLRSADVAQRDAVAANVAQNSLNAASTGLGALPSLLDLTERGANAELGVYSALGSILGGPTTLNESESSSVSSSIAQALAKSFGEQSSTSRSSSRGKGRAWSFNVGFGNSGGE